MKFSFKVLSLIGVLIFFSSFTLSEKELDLANKSKEYTETTFKKMKACILFANEFNSKNAKNSRVDFTTLESKYEALGKHISKGVKLSLKVYKKLEKRESEMSKDLRFDLEDLYLYQRGQEDFYECYDRLEQAKNEDFQKGMSYFSSRMGKALNYIEYYQRCLTKFIKLK